MQETQETQSWSLDWEDPLKNEMGTHSSILVWRIPWQKCLEGYGVHIHAVQMVGVEAAPALPPPYLDSSLQFSSLSLPGQISGSSLSWCPPGEWIDSPSLQGSPILWVILFFSFSASQFSVLEGKEWGVGQWSFLRNSKGEIHLMLVVLFIFSYTFF